MKYIITHCKPSNNWLDTEIVPYDHIDGYTVKKESSSGISLSATPIFESFQNVIEYFLTAANDEWYMKQIKCFLEGSYNIYEEENYVEDIKWWDEETNTTYTETISGTRQAVVDTIPIINMKLKDSSKTLENSERSYFIKTTDLPKPIEESMVSIWNYFHK